MDKKIVTFDLDGTLLTMDYQTEGDFFREVFSDEDPEVVERFIRTIPDELNSYERTYRRYEVGCLNVFLNKRINLPFSEKIIESWIDVVGQGKDVVCDGVFEILPCLLERDYMLGLATNWFKTSQEKRLKNNNLYDFFESCVFGDNCLKPNRSAYEGVSGSIQKNNCFFVGDDYDKDYLWPKIYGFNAILFDQNDKDNHDSICKIKKLTDLKELL